MFPPKLLTFMLTLLGLSCFFTQAQATAGCNPLAGDAPSLLRPSPDEADVSLATCPANPGLGFQSYFVDFTKESSLPANWTLATYENVTYGANGAEFTFAKRGDAPTIWTDFYILFGHLEVVMQAAPGTGIISSSVLLSDDADEIDWEFSGNNFNNRSGLGETNYFGKGINTTYDRATYAGVGSPQTKFYAYSIDWTPNSLIWSIDGIPVRTLSNTNANSGPYQYPQSPMKLQIGLWDAGDVDGAPATVEWAGGYTDVSRAPFTMYVKSVRIFNLNPCSGGYQYTDMSGSFQSIKCLYTDNLSSSSSTPARSPVGSNPAGTAPPPLSMPASTGTSNGDTSGTRAPTSSAKSETVIVSLQNSPSTTAPTATSSVETTCASPMVVSSSSSPSSSPSSPAKTSTISSSLTTTCTSTPITSTSQAPVSSSSNRHNTAMTSSQASVCTSPTVIPSVSANSANSAMASDSTSPSSSASSSTNATDTIPSTASTTPTTSPTVARTTSSQISFSTQSTSAGTKLRPWTGWMLFFG